MVVLAVVVAVVYFFGAMSAFAVWCKDIKRHGGLGGLLAAEIIWFVVVGTFGFVTWFLYTMMTRGIL